MSRRDTFLTTLLEPVALTAWTLINRHRSSLPSPNASSLLFAIGILKNSIQLIKIRLISRVDFDVIMNDWIWWHDYVCVCVCLTGRHLLLELRSLRPVGVRRERVQVRRLRARPMALRRQTRLFRPGNAVHAMGFATGTRSSLRLVLRHPPHRLRYRHFHPSQRNAHRQGLLAYFSILSFHFLDYFL